MRKHFCRLVPEVEWLCGAGCRFGAEARVSARQTARLGEAGAQLTGNVPAPIHFAPTCVCNQVQRLQSVDQPCAPSSSLSIIPGARTCEAGSGLKSTRKDPLTSSNATLDLSVWSKSINKFCPSSFLKGTCLPATSLTRSLSGGQ